MNLNLQMPIKNTQGYDVVCQKVETHMHLMMKVMTTELIPITYVIKMRIKMTMKSLVHSGHTIKTKARKLYRSKSGEARHSNLIGLPKESLALLRPYKDEVAVYL